ncbi:hypothetical protein L7F22_036801 [Adiantum nelumboides]|nr:hypothetical protein [Adiantum nelumboides]
MFEKRSLPRSKSHPLQDDDDADYDVADDDDADDNDAEEQDKVGQTKKRKQPSTPTRRSPRTKSPSVVEPESMSPPLSKQAKILFVDDYSKYAIINFIKHKSEVFQHFKNYHNFVERHTGHRLQTFRSDNGGEYTSHEFWEYCLNLGIAHQFTIPYTPQQNGLAKRKWGTLFNASHSMLQVADLPQSFWEEASATACYLQNRLPSKTLPNVTPYQRWTQEKPELSHVRIFGTPCYSLIPTEARTKLDPRAERCILVGYGEHFGVKTYRLYNRTTRRFVFSRDVVFNEDALLSTSITSPSRDFSPSPRTHRPGHPLDADDNTYNFEELTSQNFPPPFPVIIPMPPPQAQPLEATIPNIPTPAREFVFQARRPTATQPRRRIQNYSLPDTGVTQITYPTPQRTTSSSRRGRHRPLYPSNFFSC